MTRRIWRGDAVAVSQVTHITPSNVEIGDVYSVTINGKTISVTAAAASAANVVTLLIAAISASTIQEFAEITATGTNYLILTANTAGVPFTVTAGSSNGSALGVTVSTTTNGAAATSAVNMTQTFRIPISAAGTFKLWLGGASTSAIAVAASAATVQTAIEALAVVGAGNASVAKSSDTNDDIYVVTFQGTLAATTVALMNCILTTTKAVVRTTQQGSTSGTPANEVQEITFGDNWAFDGSTVDGVNYTLTLDAQTTASISWRSTPATVQAQLRNLAGVEDTDLNVSASGNVLIVDFVTREGGANQSQITTGTFTSSTTMAITIAVSSTPASGVAAAVNEVQVVTLTGVPTGGTFTLTFSGDTTAGIAYNAAASAVVTALENLSVIGVGDVAVTGSAGGPWTVTFQAALAGTNHTQMTADGSSLTGGSSQTIGVTESVASSGPNHWDTAANWLPSGVPVNSDDVRFEFGSVDCLYGIDQSAVTLARLEIASNYTGVIGLSRLNSNGYVEYRTRDLTIKSPVILIGVGNGSGSGKIQLNTLTTATALEIRNSGGSRESGVPAVTWYGDHASNSIKLLSGDLGVAIWSDQTATVNTVQQYGGSLRLDHTAISDLYCPGQSVSAHESTLGGEPLEL